MTTRKFWQLGTAVVFLSAVGCATDHAQTVTNDVTNPKDGERKILTEESSLNPDSAFVKQAQEQLKALNANAFVVPAPKT